MKLGEVVVCYPCVLQFHQVSPKSDEKQIIAHFSVQNLKVSVELSKSYIVREYLVSQLFSTIYFTTANHVLFMKS